MAALRQPASPAFVATVSLQHRLSADRRYSLGGGRSTRTPEVWILESSRVAGQTGDAATIDPQRNNLIILVVLRELTSNVLKRRRWTLAQRSNRFPLLSGRSGSRIPSSSNPETALAPSRTGPGRVRSLNGNSSRPQSSSRSGDPGYPSPHQRLSPARAGFHRPPSGTILSFADL